jgi:hypothetical protein
MVAKIGQSRAAAVSLPKETKSPAKAAQASNASTTQKAWGPSGANKKPQVGGGLTISKAEIGDGPQTSEKLTLPKGYSQVSGSLTHSESMPLADGRTAKLDINHATVSIKGPGGKSVEIAPSDQKEIADMKQWFQEEFKGKSKADLEFASFPEWNDDKTISGAGGAGKLTSVMISGNQYSGGAHPNHYTQVGTFDVTTGKQVKLDELLPKATVDKLATNVLARLQTMSGPDSIEGSAFALGGDEKTIRDLINSSFALTQGKNGKVNIELTWDSGVHALGGLLAHFTVPAPDDAAFKAKIGLE